MKKRDLGYRFDVSESVITSIVHKWLNILFVAFKFLTRWPSREEVQKTLSECFCGNFQGQSLLLTAQKFL